MRPKNSKTIVQMVGFCCKRITTGNCSCKQQIFCIRFNVFVSDHIMCRSFCLRTHSHSLADSLLLTKSIIISNSIKFVCRNYLRNKMEKIKKNIYEKRRIGRQWTVQSGSACSITKAASKMINDKISRDGLISSTIKL